MRESKYETIIASIFPQILIRVPFTGKLYFPFLRSFKLYCPKMKVRGEFSKTHCAGNLIFVNTIRLNNKPGLIFFDFFSSLLPELNITNVI